MEFDLASFKKTIETDSDKLTVIIKNAHTKKITDDVITSAVEHIVKQDPLKRISGECLQKAACFGYIKLAKLLLDNGVPIDVRDKMRNTPLINACRTHHAEVAMYLIERGAFVNARNTHGWSPLQYACMSNEKELVKRLIEHRANIHLFMKDDRKNIINKLIEKNAEQYAPMIDYLRTVKETMKL